MSARLQDRSPLHMLPYPTHAYPTMSARRHANSQPNPNDHNFWKYRLRLGLATHLTSVHTCTHAWHTTIMKIITQGMEENTKQKVTQPKIDLGGWM